MPKESIPNKILWLASYPKSGNTWFRAFLTALLGNGEIRIDKLQTDGIFSNRKSFDLACDLNSRDLYDHEVKSMISSVFEKRAKDSELLSIIKIHDSFSYDLQGAPIVPHSCTHAAIYFVRNPLDVAGSFAHHMDKNIDNAVKLLNNPLAQIAQQPGNLNTKDQFVQHLGTWSQHVESWTTLPQFPVLVIRYEDMLQDAYTAFQKAVSFIGWDYTEEQIRTAIAAVSFDQLSEQEKTIGFPEKKGVTASFFRSGTAGNWKRELTDEQVKAIVACNGYVMKQYQYLP